jgi:protocatechuate 3,4-dioxygenase beta subunit
MGEHPCPATEDNPEGPFWRPGAAFRTKLRTAGDRGEVLVVSGQVLGRPDCVPLPEALLDVWQADATGRYDNREDVGGAELRFRARMRTGEDGSYGFETVVPAPYWDGPRIRAAHIHFRVSCYGYLPLTTQLYFEGDPYLETDEDVKPSLVHRLERHDSEDEIAARDLDGPFLTCDFDVVLEPEFILGKLDKHGKREAGSNEVNVGLRVLDRGGAGRAVPPGLHGGPAGGVAGRLGQLGVLRRPVAEQPECAGQPLAPSRQLVDQPQRALRVRADHHEPLALQVLQPLGQDVGRDPRHLLQEILEAPGPGEQRLDQEQRPAVPHAGDRLGER